MVELKSKEIERSELNRAIEAFIANGGKIKKVEVGNDQNSETSGLSADKFDPYVEPEDPDSETFSRLVRRNSIDY